MPVNADIFEERDDWRRPLAVSLALHVLLFGSLLLYAVLTGGTGESWGGAGSGGGAMSATLVNSVPLPANPEATNVLATESKGLTQSLPKEEVKEPDAVPIPDKETKRKPAPKVTTPTPAREAPRETATVDNKIPFGQGGPVSGPYGVFNSGGAKGGFGFSGGGGDFGSRYSWYVDVVRKKVSENWLKYEIDPSISTARRVYIYFEIGRSGSPKNVKVEQSSGIPALDQSAMRALQRIDTFGPLPGDYRGSSVAVEFWFDYKR
ncbi:MAG TPA: TonB family protein [Clostridia bacterium]|nr:TonB family protein [Clostridia bacterium]